MSGIVGILNLNGAPVDQRLLRRMTDFMAFRGPDAQQICSQGPVGFGHTMLRTTDESANERQPLSFDGNVTITADARIDDRQNLVRKLTGKGRDVSLSAPDVELILHAYLVWGQDCVEHLLGDFAFAIWDDRERRLFCARDHFGIKPFFYAQVGDCLVFSNTLNCVRLHLAVSDELNEQFIGDFLLFDASHDLSNTAFADVHRLPPAHYLIWSEGRMSLRRYWTLSDGDLIKYRRKSEYVEQFLELLQTAVSDRLRTNNVGILMSGGLDSSAVAAIACELRSKQSASFELEAHTAVYDRLFPDEERYYAGLVAEALKIPIHFFVADDYLPFAGFDRPELRQPEPVNNPFLKHYLDLTRQSGERQRVVLTGSDGDTFFFELPNAYFSDLFKQRRFGRLLLELARYSWTQGELPRVGFRAWLKRQREKPAQPEYPVWLNPDFAERLNLPERWAEYSREQTPHPIRPRIYRVLNAPIWSQHFESQDANVTGLPIEYRHPLADLRLLEFGLSLPPVPCLVKKELLREAMHGILPELVRVRPKSPLAGDPFRETLRERRSHPIDPIDPIPMTENYIERAAIPAAVAESDVSRLWMNSRPLSLNYWLEALTAVSHKSQLEEKHEPLYFGQVG